MTLTVAFSFRTVVLTKQPFVKRLAGDLRAAGATVFYDDWSLKPGDRLRDRISEEIRQCTHFLVILSVRSVKSRWVQRELDEAMILEIQGRGPKIIPLTIGRLKNDSIPTDLMGLLWVDFRPGGEKRYRQSLSRLQSAIGLSPLLIPGSAESEIKQSIDAFLAKIEADEWDEEEFWNYWTEPVAKRRWLSLLNVTGQLLEEGLDEQADFAFDALQGVVNKHSINVDNCPRKLLQLLSSDFVDDIGKRCQVPFWLNGKLSWSSPGPQRRL